MAWIRTIDEPEAGTELHHIYEEQLRQAGSVANILKVHSLDSVVLAAHLRLYQATMHGNAKISRRDREMIAVAVSRTNNCEY